MRSVGGLVSVFSPCTGGDLTAGEGRCRDAGHDEGRRNHESNDQFTHESFLHERFEVVLETLSCMKGITPRIAVDELY